MKEIAVYTCGRMHKPVRKTKLSAIKANALLGRLDHILKLETTTSAEVVSLLQSELIDAKFVSQDMKTTATNRVPRLWLPSKPKVTLALMEALKTVHESDCSNMRSAGANGLTKLVARHVVADVLNTKGSGWMHECGELTVAQLESPIKTSQTLSRTAFDMLVYVHARAEEIRQRDGADVVLELQSSDETLCGRDLRGCGVVYCTVGRSMFDRASAEVFMELSNHSKANCK